MWGIFINQSFAEGEFSNFVFYYLNFALIMRPFGYHRGKQDMTQAVNAELSEIIFGKVHAEAAFEMFDLGRKLAPV
jgi:hypothetical protein